ncbi:MAG: ABC transporter permease [Eubacterium sp.]|nr:ABC transporter permease [Eubacterium sp.]
MKTLIKTSAKLLVRTKAFWFFMLLMPMLSTLILKIKFDSSAAYTDNYKEEIIELSDTDAKVAYNGGKGEFVIKVYDASKSELSEYLLERIAKSGMFLVCRADLTGKNVSPDFMKKQLERDGFEDKMGAAIYIPADFDEQVTGGNPDKALTLYVLSEDTRESVLESELSLQLGRIIKNPSVKYLQEEDDRLPEKELISVAAGSQRELSQKQTNQRSQMGYAFAFMTLGFVFCGIFVAHACIREQKEGVFTRLTLTKIGAFKYFFSKFAVAALVSAMATGVMAVCTLFISTDDIGMSRLSFIGMIFMMGLIFCILSMIVGILMGDIMGANVAAFTIWCISALLSGLYFPLNYTSNALKLASYLMPQKWFLEGTEMIFVGDKGASFMILCTTVAFLAVILSLGSLGLKVKRTDGWGNA